jgi:hypothetical protein
MGMWFGEVPPFTKRVKFEFDERVNVFVGPNASGKSTLLMALARYFKVLDEGSDAKRPVNDAYMDKFTELDFDDVEEFDVNGIAAPWDWFGDRDAGNPAVVHLDSVRVGLPGMSMLNTEDEERQSAADILSGPFSGSQTFRALEALVREAAGNQSDISNIVQSIGIRKAIEVAVSCTKMICNEVISDTTTRNYIPEFATTDYSDDPVGHLDQMRVLRGAAISTSDVRNFSNYPLREKPSWDRYHEDLDSAPIYIGHLSSGTEGTLLWIQWLALKILHYYEFAGGWENRPAILLIDEIENHLHPTWQRRVIPALLEHFPGLQIFATTHSPFVVAGREVGQVNQLIRDTNGLITARTNTEPIKGWTADEISRKYLEVQDPTDLVTAEAAAELRRLRDEGPRPEPVDEEQRRERMQELRQLVDRDLLAGGPMAARRELFEQQFAEALEKHRRSQELNQDIG